MAPQQKWRARSHTQIRQPTQGCSQHPQQMSAPPPSQGLFALVLRMCGTGSSTTSSIPLGTRGCLDTSLTSGCWILVSSSTQLEHPSYLSPDLVKGSLGAKTCPVENHCSDFMAGGDHTGLQSPVSSSVETAHANQWVAE